MARIVITPTVRAGKMRIRLRHDTGSRDSVREANLSRDLFQTIRGILEAAARTQDFQCSVEEVRQ